MGIISVNKKAVDCAEFRQFCGISKWVREMFGLTAAWQMWNWAKGWDRVFGFCVFLEFVRVELNVFRLSQICIATLAVVTYLLISKNVLSTDLLPKRRHRWRLCGGSNGENWKWKHSNLKKAGFQNKSPLWKKYFIKLISLFPNCSSYCHNFWRKTRFIFGFFSLRLILIGTYTNLRESSKSAIRDLNPFWQIQQILYQFRS